MRGLGWSGFIVFGVCLAGAGFAASRYLAPPNQVEPHAEVAVLVGKARVVVNSAFMVRRSDRLGGRIDDLPLALDAKTMEPAGPLRPLGLRDADSAAHILYVTLRARDEKLAPNERTSRLYLRHLQPDSAPSVAGLLRRAFADSSPYRNEDLHFTPPAGDLFAARCLRDQEHDIQPDVQHDVEKAEDQPAEKPALMLKTCVADLRVGAVDVRLRFSQSLLEDWERTTAAAISFVTALLRKQD
jgi:hypothetical protein